MTAEERAINYGLARDLVAAAYLILKEQNEGTNRAMLGELMKYIRQHVHRHGNMIALSQVLMGNHTPARLGPEMQAVLDRILRVKAAVQGPDEFLPPLADISANPATAEDTGAASAADTDTDTDGEDTDTGDDTQSATQTVADNTKTTPPVRKKKACCN